MKILKNITLTIIFLLLMISNTWAAPLITSVTGAIEHGGSITISGSGFGTKNPAAPLVWDPCDHNDLLSVRYSHYIPTLCGDSYYNIAYRSTPFRDISSPSSHSTKIIAGAHYPNLSGDYSYSAGNNVALTKAGWNGSKKLIMMYYYRMDPNFPVETSPDGPNLKEWAAQTTNEIYGDGPGTWAYIDHSNANVPANIYPDDVCMKTTNCDSCCVGINGSRFPNPMRTDVGPGNNGWQKYEWVVKLEPDGFIKFYVDSTLAINCPDGDVAGNSSMEPASASIGGFTRVPTANPSNAWRYFSEVYIDNTFSRVILTDNVIYDSATIKEPQIPSAWATGEITATVNLGKLTTETKYLYVCDSDNSCNANGYLITLGGGNIGTGTSNVNIGTGSGNVTIY